MRRDKKRFGKRYFFKTFLYNGLKENDEYRWWGQEAYKGRRHFLVWGVIFPIDMDDCHGIFVYVDIKKKTIILYNSAINVGENKLVLDTILQYVQSEHSDKLKTELQDVGIWQQNATILQNLLSRQIGLIVVSLCANFVSVLLVKTIWIL